MNDELMWGMLTMVLSGAFGRIVKAYPKVPKGLLPWLVLLCGYGITFVMAIYGGASAGDAALSAWTGLGWGMAAIGGHESLKPLLRMGMSDEAASKLLGRLPAPKEGK